jgi:hypothetical protein
MDLGGVPVHHGLATMAGLGLTGAGPFGRSGQVETNGVGSSPFIGVEAGR